MYKCILIAVLSFTLLGCPSHKVQKTATENLSQAQEFLNNNITKDGVLNTPSGLQYKILTPGKGKLVSPDSTVDLNYVGKMLGSEAIFDSSELFGTAKNVTLNSVILGWEEGLQLMREGDVFIFFIPPHLAYGKKGTPNDGIPVPPNKLLIYEVTLIKVRNKKL